MRIAAIVERLRDQCPELKLVGGAASLERAVRGLTTTPAAFVVSASEAAEPSPFMDQIVQQRVAAEVQVFIATRNLADDLGEAALEMQEPVRESIRAAFLNWAPGAEFDGLEFTAGASQMFENGVLWWLDTYSTGFNIRSE